MSVGAGIIPASKLKMEEVKSSNLHSLGYDQESHTLAVKFKNSGLYLYLNVPPEVNQELMNQESKGSYVSNVVRKFYFSVEVQPAT